MAAIEPIELESMLQRHRIDNYEIAKNISDRRKSASIVLSFALAGLCTLLYFVLRGPTVEKDNQIDSGQLQRQPVIDTSGVANANIDTETGDDTTCESQDNEQNCLSPDYAKTTTKAIYEHSVAALLFDTRDEKKFEASDVIIVGDYAYVVCDNSWAITKLHLPLQTFSKANVQIGNPHRVESEDSDYEAIFYHENIFYAVRESVKLKLPKSKKSSYHAVIEELKLSDKDYVVENTCPCEFEFEGTSKGFEGAVGMTSEKGDLLMLALCEGNYCSEKRKNEGGNGRIVVMRKQISSKTAGHCIWETMKVIDIPVSANFSDYSAIALSPDGRITIASQEDSKLWFGQLLGIDDNGHLDVDHAAFDSSMGRIVSFPRSENCFLAYCNIEGIAFLNDDMFIAVSDKMKKGGKQDYRCLGKDQAVHVFMLP